MPPAEFLLHSVPDLKQSYKQGCVCVCVEWARETQSGSLSQQSLHLLVWESPSGCGGVAGNERQHGRGRHEQFSHWPAKLAYLVKSRPVRDTVSKSKTRYFRNDTEADLRFHTHVHIHKHASAQLHSLCSFSPDRISHSLNTEPA